MTEQKNNDAMNVPCPDEGGDSLWILNDGDPGPTDENETKETFCKINPESVNAGQRLDIYLSNVMGLSRSFIQHLIKDGNVVNDQQIRLKQSNRVQSGQQITVTIPPVENLQVTPEPVPFDVLYEDASILVINKPAGIVVHPAPGNWHGTLVHGLIYRYPEIGLFNNVIRPGIVHRLDQSTSGLMIIARDQQSMEGLQAQFKARSVIKKYLALTRGVPSHKEGLIDLPIGRDPRNRKRMAILSTGRESRTLYRVLWSCNNHSLVECTLLTGRTHQIRVHLRYLGCPLAGDILYGGRNISYQEMGRVFLHSWKLGFIHPVTLKRLYFTQPLPPELIVYLQNTLSRDQG